MQLNRKHLLALAPILVLAGLALADVAGRDGAPVYLTAPVERGDVVSMVTATGTLNAVVTVRVGSQLSGQIRELLVDFNDEVRKGQPIARLDPETYAARVREAEAALEVAQADVLIQKAAVERARADWANARASRAVADAQLHSAAARRADAGRELARRQALRERGNVAQSEVDRALTEDESAAALVRAAEAEREVREAAILAAAAGLRMAEASLQNARAAVRQRQAALDQAKVDRARTVIHAPIDGVVIGRNVDHGQTVAASLEAPTLFTLAQDLRRMEVYARIDEADIGRVRPGQRATFTVDAYPGRVFDGTVVQVRKAPEVVQNVVTYTVLISAENPELALLPGMTAIVHIVVEEIHDVLKVPNAALRFRGLDGAPAGYQTERMAATTVEAVDGTPALVWVPGDGREPSPVPIGIGSSDPIATEILSGPLREGQPVMVGAAADEGAAIFGFRLGL